MKFPITSRWSGSVLFEIETDSLRLCLEAAVKAGADLARANLVGANLVGANLAGANLMDANLAGANLAGANLMDANLVGADLARADLVRAYGRKLTLIGKQPALVIGPLGSRCAYLTAFLTDAGVYIRTGCFWDTLDAFRAAVESTHGTNEHGREYRAAIALIETHAELWTPAVAPKETA
ncbi:MAG TPA: pentapeptide repeat-containing protein [Thauera aminoaromatica]|nr:pentapeptide repeat-containing protein [Thauera aminoaromatica]